MSFKRPGSVFHFKQPKIKMPKLDVSIIGSQDQNYRDRPSTSQINKKETMNEWNHRNIEKESVDMWNDGDDDVILLASQKAENIIFNEQAFVGAMNNHEDSYSGFIRGPAIESSTQKPSSDDALQDFFESNDDEDMVLSQVPDFKCVNSTRHFDNIKIDPKPSTSKEMPDYVRNGVNIPDTRQEVISENIQNVRSKAKDLQLGLMTTNLEQMKRENDYIKSELEKLKAKYQTKEGEASMLRYDLQRKCKTLEEIRRDKQDDMFKIKETFSAEKHEMERLIEELQSKLEFKELEIIKIKTKKNNESLLSTSIVKDRQKNQKAMKCSRLMYSVRVADLHINYSKPLEIDRKIFENSTLNESKIENLFCLNLKDSRYESNVQILQNCLSELMTIKADKYNVNCEFQKKITTTLLDVSLDIENYSKSIGRLNQRETILQFKTNDLQSSIDSTINPERSYQESKLYNKNECPIRKAILCISYIYQLMPEIIELSHRESDDQRGVSTFFKSLNSCLTEIAFSNEVIHHQGIVSAACTLLSILSQCNINITHNQNVLCTIFHSITLCQPNKSSLLWLSEFLFNISKSNEKIKLIENLCIRCGNAISRPYARIIQCSLETCPLQIYAFMVQREFRNFFRNSKNFEENRVATIELIAFIKNNLLFLQNCFSKSVTWLTRKQETMCLCYMNIVCMCIMLVHLCMKQWKEGPLSISMNDISMISRLFIRFLYNCLVINFQKEILRVGGSSVKNELQTLYDWLQQYNRLFSWSKSHVNALKAIDLRSYMIEPLRNENSQQNSQHSNADDLWQNLQILK